MCGISGILYGRRPVDRQVLETMTLALQHRGPDAQGIWMHPEGRLGLGHRRLSIIDLAAGQQPMADDSGQYHLVFNGEIYNFRELRAELEKDGFVFRTDSDTEVILYAYRKWGKACVQRLRGMFAFAIADEQRRELFLARDHFGIKPLYYWPASGGLAFASELQALKKLPEFQGALNWNAIDTYLWFQYIPHPETAFEGVYKLPPGHHLTVGFDGKVGAPERYWSFQFQPEEERSEAEWLEEVEATIRESVRAHLVSDVPFGAFLSGGIDSSLVVTEMARILDQPVKTFSIGFKETKYNELDYAEQVADKWQTEHHTEIVEPQGLSILPDLVRHYGEPFGDSSAIPTWYVSRMARREVTMVLTGDGGDELFAGYSRYSRFLEALRPFPFTWKKFKSLFYASAHRMDPFGFPNRFNLLRGPDLYNLIEFVRITPGAVRSRLWKPDYAQYLQKANPLFESVYEAGKKLSAVRKFQHLDIHTYLPLDILTKVDVASMMHSLEVRPPLIDVKVAEVASRVPAGLNMQRIHGQFEGKMLLKKILGRYFDPAFVYREKKGFAMPLEYWFGADGGYEQELRDRLFGPDSKLREIFEGKVLERIIRERHFAGATWQFLVLEEWLRQN